MAPSSGPSPWWWSELGIVGFSDLAPAEPGGPAPKALAWLDVVYRAIRLFALSFDLPADASPRWPLGVAVFAAPLLTLRGIAELFREQLTGRLVRHFVAPRVVVFGANERAAALIAASERPGRWTDAIVVVDPDPQALATITAPRVWTVRGNGFTTDSLIRAGLSRAASAVVVTGDNARNSAITTAVLDLKPVPKVALYVEVEEPALARTLEQGGQRAGIEITAFSAAGLTAAAVLDEVAPAGGSALLAADPDGNGPTMALFGTGALVEAVVLELHRHRRVQLLDDPAARRAVPRILLFGPDASERRRRLATLMGTDLQLLDIDPLDVDLGQVVELDDETSRHLSRPRELRLVLVLTPSDLDGGGIAMTLARHRGSGHEIVLVTESRTTPFGDEIREQTRGSATLADVRLVRVPDKAYRLTALQAERVVDRLARACYEVEHPRGTWATLVDRQPYLDRARRAARGDLEGSGGTVPGADADGPAVGRAALRRSALASPEPPERAPLAALGFHGPTALARAGLGVDFTSLTALVPAGRILLARGDDAAFGVWAEIARLRTDPAALAADLPAATNGAGAGGAGTSGEGFAAVRDLLLLRRTALGCSDARRELIGDTAVTRRPAGDPANPIVLLAGPVEDRAATRVRLEPTLAHLPAVTAVWATAGVRALIEDPPPNVRGPADHRGGPADALAMWKEVLACGHHPADVRVLALPGTTADDLLLGRALGATIGRVEGPGAPNLTGVLLNGATAILPLPDDRATIRAFLRPGRWPDEHREMREPLARELHQRYVIRQRPRNPPAIRRCGRGPCCPRG